MSSDEDVLATAASWAAEGESVALAELASSSLPADCDALITVAAPPAGALERR